MSLRDEQRDLTRSRIVRAVLDLLETDSPATISVPAVAGRAGVSLRTVYRYFPTKADLIHSAAHVFDDPITQRLGQQPDDRGADLGEYLRRLWAEFGQNVPAVRAQHQSAADLVDDILWKAIGRNNTSRITGVHTSFFDVLHDARHDNVFAIAECIYIHLGRIL